MDTIQLKKLKEILGYTAPEQLEQKLVNFVDQLQECESTDRYLVMPEAVANYFHIFTVQSNGGNNYDNSVYVEPTYWFVVDRTTAEPEVNWPGELVSEHTSKEEAYKALWTTILEYAAKE